MGNNVKTGFTIQKKLKNVGGLIALFIVAFAFSASVSAGTNLVQNGDFSATTNGAGQLGYNTNATDWATTGYNFLFTPGVADTTGVTSQYSSGNWNLLSLWGPNNGSNNGFTAASPTGGNFIAGDGAFQVGSISQAIAGLTVGEQYNVSFWWAAAQQYGYTGANTEQWQVSLGSQTINTAVYNNASHGFSGWQQETFSYTATAATEALSFLAVGTPSGQPPFSLLANVSLEVAGGFSSVSSGGAAAVPEPEMLALMGIGLLGLISVRRQKMLA
jgi:hypothetical protein